MNNDTSPERQRQIYGMLCGALGIGCNLILCALKLIAGALSHSIAIVADGLNNLSDAGSSLVTLLGFRLAGKKPDKDHPFGHGRIEYLTGLAVSVMVILLGVELGKSSISQIVSPSPVVSGVVSVAILVLAIPAKLYLFFTNRKIGKQIKSAALCASATDALTDAAATLLTLVSLLIGRYLSFPLDGVCGLALAALILVSGIRSAFDTINPLLGQPPEREFVGALLDIVKECDAVLGIHDLIVHDYGPGRRMVSFHAEISSEADFLHAHDAIDNLENRLAETMGCHVVIHMDPISVNDARVSVMKEEIVKIAKESDFHISIHDLRMVEGPTHVNLVFDLVLPHRLEKNKRKIADEIKEKIAYRFPGHVAVIKVEHSYAGEEFEKAEEDK